MSTSTKSSTGIISRDSRGEDVKNFAYPDGYPLNGIPEVKALARPPRNAKEFDWGPLDIPDNEMGDGQMVRWAEELLADPPEEPFFLAAGIYRPHLPWYAPREYFDMFPPDGITPPPIKEDDLDDIPEAGLVIAEQRRGDLELVRRRSRNNFLISSVARGRRLLMGHTSVAWGVCVGLLRCRGRSHTHETGQICV